jgi:uncharacterized protein YbjT (DUF2867 family)
MKILVSGATGYVGSQLVPRLLARGHDVACLVRDPARVSAGIAEHTRLVTGDALRPESLVGAMRGVEVAYYLIHSMSASGGDFKRVRLSRGAKFRYRSKGRRSEADHLPGRIGLRNLRNFVASAKPARDRTRASRIRAAGNRVSRRHHCREWQRVF